MTTPTPISALNASDPGDETAKKYRYQYAYGCIIWIAAFRAAKDYKALWCEQHEDFLGQVSDTCFDAYQVKTRRAEIGDWQWNHDALVNTVKRFVLLDREFPGKIRHFYFVSNAQCSASEAQATNHLSPVPVLKCLALTYGPYPEFCEKCLTTLAEKTSCPRHEVCSVLQRMQINLGPPEDAFEAEIKQHHIPNINGCASLAPHQLNDLLDILVGIIWRASSRGSRSPSRHYAIINGRFDQEPQLHEKRIEVAALQTFLDGLLLPRFEYLARFKTVNLASNRDETSILHQKIVGGGLEDYYESLRRQTLSAERRLLELQDREPEVAGKLIAQVESVVLRVCEDAHLQTVHDQNPFGREMMRAVKSELKIIAERRPDEVFREPYDTLVGMSGLLSEDCKVWWSKKFKLEGRP